MPHFSHTLTALSLLYTAVSLGANWFYVYGNDSVGTFGPVDVCHVYHGQRLGLWDTLCGVAIVDVEGYARVARILCLVIFALLCVLICLVDPSTVKILLNILVALCQFTLVGIWVSAEVSDIPGDVLLTGLGFQTQISALVLSMGALLLGVYEYSKLENESENE